MNMAGAITVDFDFGHANIIDWCLVSVEAHDDRALFITIFVLQFDSEQVDIGSTNESSCSKFDRSERKEVSVFPREFCSNGSKSWGENRSGAARN